MKVAFLGSSAMDEYYELQNSPYPQMGGKALIDYTGGRCGGMVANAATVGAALGMRATLVYEFSNFEDTTQLLIDDLKAHNVATEGLSYASRHNPKCLIIKEPVGERAVFVLNKPLTTPIQFSKKQRQILLDAEYIYTSMGDLQRFENREEIFSKVRKNKRGIFIDCDSSITASELSFLQYATVVSFNEFGYENLLALGYSAAVLIEKWNISFVLVTKGAAGSTLYFRTGNIEQQSIATVVKDTTGAGDAFNVGFLYAILNNFKASDCILFATSAASVAISQLGTRVDINIDEIQRLCTLYKVGSQ